MSDTIANTPATSDTPKIGEAWGDDISEERKAELDAILAAWEAETDHGERTGPFDPGPRKPQRIRLTGADAFYLAACALVGTKPPVGDPITDLSTANAAIRNPAMHAFLDLSALHLQHADLHEAKLTGANLHKVELMGANLGGAQLARADLSGAWLTSANLRGAQLEHADLGRAQLERQPLSSGVKRRRSPLSATDRR